MNNTADVSEFENKFLGYGSWEASNWFIGLEAGLASNTPGSEAAERRSRAEAWRTMGGADALDLPSFCSRVAKSLEADPHGLQAAKVYRKFFCPAEGKPVRLQPTYRVLIIILLALRGEEPEKLDSTALRERIRMYQEHELGRSDGEDLILDFRPGQGKKARRHLEIWDPALEARAKAIAAHVTDKSNKTVIFYGADTHALLRIHLCKAWDWKPFERNAELRVETAWFQQNLIACIPHPTGKGRTNKDWLAIGSYLHGIRQATP